VRVVVFGFYFIWCGRAVFGIRCVPVVIVWLMVFGC